MDPKSTHTAHHSTAAVHFCHVFVRSHMQMHKSFILNITLTKESTQTILFPWKYLPNRKYKGIPNVILLAWTATPINYLHSGWSAQSLMSPSPNDCLLVDVFTEMCRKSGNPVSAFAHMSQYLVNIFTNCAKSAWWKQKWQDSRRHQLSFSFYAEKDFIFCFSRTLEFTLSTCPASLAGWHTWIAVN